MLGGFCGTNAEAHAKCSSVVQACDAVISFIIILDGEDLNSRAYTYVQDYRFAKNTSSCLR